MNSEFLYAGSAIQLLLVVFILAFILFFDRRKFAKPRKGFYYLAGFFIAGIVLLAISMMA